MELACNLDDMTGEAIAYAAGVLLAAGALDVYTEAIQMKKNRPAVKLCCLCRPADAERLSQLMLAHTTSWGCAAARWSGWSSPGNAAGWRPLTARWT